MLTAGPIPELILSDGELIQEQIFPEVITSLVEMDIKPSMWNTILRKTPWLVVVEDKEDKEGKRSRKCGFPCSNNANSRHPLKNF